MITTENKPDREEVINQLRSHQLGMMIQSSPYVTLDPDARQKADKAISSALSLLTQQREDEKDRARLDWLEKAKPAIEYISEIDYEAQTKEWFWKLADETGCWMADEETLRSSIDSAMASTSTTSTSTTEEEE